MRAAAVAAVLLLAACAGQSAGEPSGAGGNGGAGGAGGAGGGSPPADGGRDAPAGGSTGQGGASSSDGGGADQTASIAYALPPPRQCDNQFNVPGCQRGVASSTCGGVCQAANACENISSKPNADVGFVCPRFALRSAEMAQAALDDFGPSAPFNYAVAGHDVDRGGLDGTAQSSCCQCYQLVFDLPENEARVDGNGASAIAIPKPLIVQAFNTAAGGGQNFDVMMGAGGFGSFNACDPAFTSQPSPSGRYLYASFPEQGEPGSGGVNAATQLAGCKNERNLVTAATLSSAACRASVAAACNTFASTTLTSQALQDTVQSCLDSNDGASYYHINWQVYAKKVECPRHLTEVTGCKLAAQGLPDADPNVTTPAQAAQDASFHATSGGGAHYTTTTMQDCCKPTCAWQDYVTGNSGGMSAVGQYNSFYSCDQTGVPVTE